VFLLDHATDAYDPTALRASMGAIFSQRLVKTSFQARFFLVGEDELVTCSARKAPQNRSPVGVTFLRKVTADPCLRRDLFVQKNDAHPYSNGLRHGSGKLKPLRRF
jgi:hypothetical protein